MIFMLNWITKLKTKYYTALLIFYQNRADKMRYKLLIIQYKKFKKNKYKYDTRKLDN